MLIGKDVRIEERSRLLNNSLRVMIWGTLTFLLVANVYYPARADTITEYGTESIRPSFLLAAGTTWFTGTDGGRSVIGQLDPSLRSIKRFHFTDERELTELVLGPATPSFGSSDSSFVWFLQQKPGRIARLNPANGEVLIPQIPTLSSPTDLIIHRYGNGVLNNTLFFTEQDANRIGFLRYIGDQWTYSGFPIPTANAKPIGIAMDGRGFIWFTESEASKIGRLDPWTGYITEYTVDQASRPWGITIDRNNLIWVAMSDTNKIAQLDPQSASLNAYAIPTANSRPRYIQADTQGSIWFTEFDSGKIGRFILNNSSFVEYALPDVNSGPYHITVASSTGDVWATETRANKIARVLLDERATISPTKATTSTALTSLTLETASTTSLQLTISSTSITGTITTPSRMTTITSTTTTTTTSSTVSLATTMTSPTTTAIVTQSTITATLTTTPGRCLIASAAYGSHLAPEVQLLRTFRDQTLMSTFAGAQFMRVFNDFYYSFSPAVAEIVSSDSIIAETMRIAIAPLILILKPLTWLAGTETEVILGGLTAATLFGITYLTLPVLLAAYDNRRYDKRKHAPC